MTSYTYLMPTIVLQTAKIYVYSLNGVTKCILDVTQIIIY